MNKAELTLLILLFSLVFLGIMIGVMGHKLLVDLREWNITSKKDMALSDSNATGYYHCEGMDLNNTSYCLRDWVFGFFDYKKTEDSFTENRTMEDIIQNGGDCYDYTLLYKKAFTDLGFKTEQVIICGPKICHSFLIAYDQELNYCRMDQLANPVCI